MDFKEFKGGGQRSFFGYFLVGVIGAIIGGFLVIIFAPASIFPSPATAPAPELPKAQEQKVNVTTDVSTAASKVSPSVVGIVTTKLEKNLFDQTKKTGGVGSGIIVNESGYILTNNHVASMKENSITVTTADGKEHVAKPVWADASLDLSIIKIEGSGFNAAGLGDSRNIVVGEPAIAIGNPLGLTFQRTVTSGIISAVNRTLEVEKGVYMEDLIQTDASINPGNSGGPLVNIKGEVIGINTAKVSTAEGIGFSVPINIIKPVIDTIVKTGSFETPYIGITGIDKEVSGYYGVNITSGIYVVKVDKRGPSVHSGITEDDIILEVEGKAVNTMMEFKEAIYLKKPGEDVKLKIKNSKGESKEINITLSEQG